MVETLAEYQVRVERELHLYSSVWWAKPLQLLLSGLTCHHRDFSLQVSPVAAIHNRLDRRVTHGEALRKFCQRDARLTAQPPNFNHIGFGQKGPAVGFSLWPLLRMRGSTITRSVGSPIRTGITPVPISRCSAATGITIRHVVGGRSFSKVPRVTARRVVARVDDEHPRRDGPAGIQLEGESMSSHRFAQ